MKVPAAEMQATQMRCRSSWPSATRRAGHIQRRPAPGAGLQNAAAQRTGVRTAPESLEPARQRPAVRHRQPEAEQQPLLVGGAVILVAGAAMEDDVVVQQLDVTRNKRRVKADLLRDRREQVQRLVLRRG